MYLLTSSYENFPRVEGRKRDEKLYTLDCMEMFEVKIM